MTDSLFGVFVLTEQTSHVSPGSNLLLSKTASASPSTKFKNKIRSYHLNQTLFSADVLRSFLLVTWSSAFNTSQSVKRVWGKTFLWKHCYATSAVGIPIYWCFAIDLFGNWWCKTIQIHCVFKIQGGERLKYTKPKYFVCTCVCRCVFICLILVFLCARFSLLILIWNNDII